MKTNSILADVDEDDFLFELAAAEVEAALAKRRKVMPVETESPSIKYEGAYTAALKGSKSYTWQQNSLHQVAVPAPGSREFDGGGVTGGGGGGDSCFKCGQSGHWSRDCPTGGSDSSFPEKKCPCGYGSCFILTANTVKNPGRKFYKCPNREENGGCGFFEWCDGNQPSGGTNNATPSYANPNISSFPDLPCSCGAGSCLIRTAKTGQNMGRQFYCCPMNQDSCGFFKWCEDQTVKSAVPYSSPMANNFNNNSNKSYDSTRTSSACFKCGKEGHFSRDCPCMPSYPNTESGMKNVSTGTCYKCGREGHFSRNCPALSSYPQMESGMKNVSAGTCYKCGKEGHFARDCSSSSAHHLPQSGLRTQSSGGCFKCGKDDHWARDCSSSV